MPYEGPGGPAMLEAAPVKVRVMLVEFCQAGSTTTVSPASSTPFMFDVAPVPCMSAVSAAAAGRLGVCVGVGTGVPVLVGVGVEVGVGVIVGVLVGV